MSKYWDGWLAFILILAALGLPACRSDSQAEAPENSPPAPLLQTVSTTELVTGLVGGMLEQESASTIGESSDQCPTLRSEEASGRCDQVDPQTIALTYEDCFKPGDSATWDGILEYHASVMNCGVSPTSTYSRQFVDSEGGRPSTGTWTASSGEKITIDHSAVNLGNYMGDVIAPIANGGYGTQVSWLGQARVGIRIAEHLSEARSFDISISGDLDVDEVVGDTTRKLNGELRVYHNRKHQTSSVLFGDVVLEDGCCFPISGTVREVDAKGSVSGEFEFVRCGQANWIDSIGESKPVTLSHCF